jgi:hypothetical protein
MKTTGLNYFGEDLIMRKVLYAYVIIAAAFSA